MEIDASQKRNIPGRQATKTQRDFKTHEEYGSTKASDAKPNDDSGIGSINSELLRNSDHCENANDWGSKDTKQNGRNNRHGRLFGCPTTEDGSFGIQAEGQLLHTRDNNHIESIAEDDREHREPLSAHRVSTQSSSGDSHEGSVTRTSRDSGVPDQQDTAVKMPRTSDYMADHSDSSSGTSSKHTSMVSNEEQEPRLPLGGACVIRQKSRDTKGHDHLHRIARNFDNNDKPLRNKSVKFPLKQEHDASNRISNSSDSSDPSRTTSTQESAIKISTHESDVQHVYDKTLNGNQSTVHSTEVHSKLKLPHINLINLKRDSSSSSSATERDRSPRNAYLQNKDLDIDQDREFSAKESSTNDDSESPGNRNDLSSASNGTDYPDSDTRN